MSKQLLLAKFPDESIYIGAYESISDWSYDWLVTKEEALQYPWGHHDILQKMEKEYPGNSYTESKGEITNICEVDLCTDYGGGFTWKGKASKEKQVIVSGHSPIDPEVIGNYVSKIPEWARVFLEDYYKEREEKFSEYFKEMERSFHEKDHN